MIGRNLLLLLNLFLVPLSWADDGSSFPAAWDFTLTAVEAAEVQACQDILKLLADRTLATLQPEQILLLYGERLKAGATAGENMKYWQEKGWLFDLDEPRAITVTADNITALMAQNASPALRKKLGVEEANQKLNLIRYLAKRDAIVWIRRNLHTENLTREGFARGVREFEGMSRVRAQESKLRFLKVFQLPTEANYSNVDLHPAYPHFSDAAEAQPGHHSRPVRSARAIRRPVP